MKVTNWEDVGPEFIDRPDKFAALVDDELILGEEVSRVLRGRLSRRQPTTVSFRFVDPDAGYRESFVLVAKDVYPSRQALDVPVVFYEDLR